MLAQGFIYSQGDGWGWTLDYLRRVVEDASLQEEGAEPTFEIYENFACTFGRNLGQMHQLLAQPTENPDFAPERADETAVQQWSERVRAQLVEALEIIGNGGAWTEDPDLAQIADGLTGLRERLLAKVSELASAGLGHLRTRVHGDLHLGQVLVAGGEVKIIDFEGEPTKSLEERRAKTSPMRDVAGVLRSFDYAAAAAAQGTQSMADRVAERAPAILEAFHRAAQEAFLGGYLEGGGELSRDLLDLFILEKAAYEVAYEAANRPAWIGTPMRGLAQIAARLTEDDG